MSPKIIIAFVGSALLLGVVLFLLNNLITDIWLLKFLTTFLGYGILLIFTIELVYRFILLKGRSQFWRGNIISILIWLLVATINSLFYIYDFNPTLTQRLFNLSLTLVVIRYIYHGIQLLKQVPKLSLYLRHVFERPALTISFSFLAVILVGTILLVMPVSTSDRSTIGFVNALFTSTSAVCVTGLTVEDTATRFSLFGKCVILSLIQIGGLGIMILSYFAAFVIGKRVSIEQKLALSYLLNEREIRRVSNAILQIVVLTFCIEILGAAFLMRTFLDLWHDIPKAIFYSFFHSISAFCNAGFALFSNSFVNFKSDIYLNLVICSLIILGGLSFMALTDIIEKLSNWVKNFLFQKKSYPKRLSLNTKVVLIMTSILLLSSYIFIYALEHPNSLLHFDLLTQYLSTFFQAVTLRTAGFNTIDIGSLRVGTLIIMCIFMMIGAASGSTGGGIKVNTVFVLFAYIRSLFKGQREVVIMKNTLSMDLISRALLVVVLAMSVIWGGTIILSITENFPLHQIIFEVTSAFGTVGLSTGITPLLSTAGKLVIILIMFIGRIGPMTLILSISRPPAPSFAKYPYGEINIG